MGATNVLITDVKQLSHSGVDGTNTTVDKNTTKGDCLEEDHDDILSMGITVTGYWTLYILILSAALVQYAVQIAKVEDEGCVYELFTVRSRKIVVTFRDKFAGLNMPTVWVVVTYAWLWVVVLSTFTSLTTVDVAPTKITKGLYLFRTRLACLLS